MSVKAPISVRCGSDSPIDRQRCAKAAGHRGAHIGESGYAWVEYSCDDRRMVDMVTDADLLLKLSNQAVQMWRDRAETAEAEVTRLTKRITALADEYQHIGEHRIPSSEEGVVVADDLRALLAKDKRA